MLGHWRWIGHTLQKTSINIKSEALSWNPQWKRKRGRPRNLWRRDLEANIKRLGLTWSQLEREAQDRDSWKTLACGLSHRRGTRYKYVSNNYANHVLVWWGMPRQSMIDLDKRDWIGYSPIVLTWSHPGGWSWGEVKEIYKLHIDGMRQKQKLSMVSKLGRYLKDVTYTLQACNNKSWMDSGLRIKEVSQFTSSELLVIGSLLQLWIVLHINELTCPSICTLPF